MLFVPCLESILYPTTTTTITTSTIAAVFRADSRGHLVIIVHDVTIILFIILQNDLRLAHSMSQVPMNLLPVYLLLKGGCIKHHEEVHYYCTSALGLLCTFYYMVDFDDHHYSILGLVYTRRSEADNYEALDHIDHVTDDHNCNPHNFYQVCLAQMPIVRHFVHCMEMKRKVAYIYLNYVIHLYDNSIQGSVDYTSSIYTLGEHHYVVCVSSNYNPLRGGAAASDVIGQDADAGGVDQSFIVCPPRGLIAAGQSNENLFSTAPRGDDTKTSTGEDEILELHQAIYGLKQSSASFWEAISSHLESIGFVSTMGDPCLMKRVAADGGMVLVCLYVDDITYAVSHDDLADKFLAELRERFVIDVSEGKPIETLHVYLN